MVRTQARTTKAYLKKAEDIMLTAIKTNNFNNLQFKLEKELQLMPQQALVLVESLANYEAQFTANKIKKVKPDVVKLSEQQITEAVKEIKIKTSTSSPPIQIKDTYKKFVDIKIKQYVRMAVDIDSQDMDEEDAIALVSDRTNGLFSTQNLVLAGLSILGTANSIRNDVVDANDMQVEWVLDLELNNCSYCQDMADDSPYDPSDVDGLIPAHSNCGCTLVPIFDALE